MNMLAASATALPTMEMTTAMVRHLFLPRIAWTPPQQQFDRAPIWFGIIAFSGDHRRTFTSLAFIRTAILSD
jgi:hypothetical protein